MHDSSEYVFAAYIITLIASCNPVKANYLLMIDYIYMKQYQVESLREGLRHFGMQNNTYFVRGVIVPIEV